MASTLTNVEAVLTKINLNDLLNNFIESKVDNLETCRALTDADLSRLGITTIGDRTRFRSEVNKGKSQGLHIIIYIYS